jgi:hypothetical protein
MERHGRSGYGAVGNERPRAAGMGRAGLGDVGTEQVAHGPCLQPFCHMTSQPFLVVLAWEMPLSNVLPRHFSPVWTAGQGFVSQGNVCL